MTVRSPALDDHHGRQHFPLPVGRQSERERYLSTLRIPKEFRRRAAASDDAFDAAVSALVVSASVGELLALQNKPDDLIEGRIWQPEHSVACPKWQPEHTL
jgi:hypothetical protein